MVIGTAVLLMTMSIAVRHSPAAAKVCMNDSQLVHVNCSSAHNASLKGNTHVTYFTDTCSQIPIQLLSFVNTIWLCPTELCPGCLHVMRTTEVIEVKDVSTDDDPAQGRGDPELAEDVSGMYAVSVNYWHRGAMTTLWVGNLLTPSFSESFIPLPGDDVGTFLTVDGIDEQGYFPFRYATCTTQHRQSPCRQDGAQNLSFSGPAAFFRPSPSTTTLPPQPSCDGGDEDEPSSTLDAFIAVTAVLVVLLVVVSGVLAVVLIRSRSPLSTKPLPSAEDILKKAFQRNESLVEQMVASLPDPRLATSCSDSSISNAMLGTASNPPPTSSSSPDADDVECGFSPASPGMSRVNEAFYIDVIQSEECPATPEMERAGRVEGPRVHAPASAVYDTLTSPGHDVEHCYAQLRSMRGKVRVQV
ncbi:uncharacterized protein LOC143290130 [Babylonia areolata]|uniref:uncharacterized protein LOC143290130 n=1 Tax=Babylonia areolata TaxID=304850 RepID=UPI003FD1E0EB